MTDEVYRPIKMLLDEHEYCHVSFNVTLLRNHFAITARMFVRYFLGDNLKPHLLGDKCIYYSKAPIVSHIM